VLVLLADRSICSSDSSIIYRIEILQIRARKAALSDAKYIDQVLQGDRGSTERRHVTAGTQLDAVVICAFDTQQTSLEREMPPS